MDEIKFETIAGFRVMAERDIPRRKKWPKPDQTPAYGDGGRVEVKARGEPLTEPVYYLGRQWAVTAYGVEARDGTYCIDADRLWQSEPEWDWIRQVCGKEWVDAEDFIGAFNLARVIFRDLKPERLRRPD